MDKKLIRDIDASKDVVRQVNRLPKMNFEDLLKAAFNIRQPFVYDDELNAPYPLRFDFTVVDDYYEAEKISSLGTPIIFPVKFKGGTYNRYNSKSEIETINFKDLWLPAVTLVDFRRAKVLTKTKPVGAKGTVKEHFGLDDWNISIRCLCLNDNEQSALAQVQAIEKFEELADSFEIEGSLFLSKKIYSLVIDEFSVTQVQSKHGAFAIDMRCLSDEPLELIL